MAITIIVIYINIIGLERKQYSLFGSSPNFEVVYKNIRILVKVTMVG